MESLDSKQAKEEEEDSSGDEDSSHDDGDSHDGRESLQDDEEEEGFPSPSSLWVSRFAVMGDSTSALVFSTLLLAIAVFVSWYLHHLERLSPEERAYRALGRPPHPVGPTVIYEINATEAVAVQITQAIQRAYQYDGVVAVRGLISPALLSDLQEATHQLVQEQQYSNARKRFHVRGKQFFTVQHGVIFRTPDSLRNRTSTDSTLSTVMDNPFLRLVIQTALPQVAATLLHPTMSDEKSSTGSYHDKNNLRILRDIFLAKDDDPYVCGWHVDDHGFWPALADAPGINAWIALDDYNDTTVSAGDQEGGFALAVGSHAADWRHEAYRVTGAAYTVPPEGFASAADMVTRRSGSGTCNIAHAAPHLQRRLEETKRVYRDLQAGDVIFHDRFLFHRTIPQTSGNNKKIRGRYSVRIGPGSSVIPPGYGTEPAVLYREDHGAQTANQVSGTWPWYPQVWPTAVDSELQAWHEFCTSIYPQAVELQNTRKQELKPHLQRLAQRQQVHPQAGNRLFDFSEGYT